MSRKRKKAGGSEATTPLSEGVPEDILAEGSGPDQAVARVAMPTDDQEPDPPVRIRKAKKSSDLVVAPVADEEVVHAAIEDLRSSAEAVETRKGKKAKQAEPIGAASDAGDAVEAAPSTSRKGKRKSADAVDGAADDASMEAVGDEAPKSREGDEESVEAGDDDAVEVAGDDEVVEGAPPKSRTRKRVKSADATTEATEPTGESLEAAGEEAPKSRKSKRAKADEHAEGASIEAAADTSVESEDKSVEATSDDAPSVALRKRKGKRATEQHIESIEVAAAESVEDESVGSEHAVEAPRKKRTNKRAEPTEQNAEGESIEAAADESVESEDESVETGSEAVEGTPRKGKRAQAADSGSLEAAADVDASDDDEATDESLEATEADAVAAESVEGEAIEASGIDGDQPAMEAGADGADGVAAEGEEGEGVAALPTSATELDAPALKQLVEALVFASDKPMTVQKLRQLTRVSDIPRLEQALFELAEDYADRGIVLQQVSGGYQFRTRTQWSQWVQQLIAGRPVRLTRAQLETLAIVAYRQPITRPEIDEIRGVDSSATLKLLMDRQLIRILGKKEEVGRPMLYGTTKEFLDFFSLGDLRELPTLREYSELTPESRQVITDKLGDLPDDDGSGNGGPGEGGMGGGPSGGGSSEELGAAPEPTAADLIAKYVAELDADSVREENAERDARNARIDEDERMVFDALDDELDANTHARGSAPEIETAGLREDATDDDGEHVTLDASDADAMLDASDPNAPIDAGDAGDAGDADSKLAGESIDAPAAGSEVVADDAAELAEEILAMAPSTEPSSADASSPEAVLASARLANDAAELADAILTSPSITDDLAFDLSDAMTASLDGEASTQPQLELHEGSLAELDPFMQEREAGEASIGDAFVGESLVADHDRVAIAAVVDVEVPAAMATEGDAFVAASILVDPAGETPVRLSPADEAFVAQADVDEIPPAIGFDTASPEGTEVSVHVAAPSDSEPATEPTTDALHESSTEGSSTDPATLFADAAPEDVDAGTDVVRGLFAEGSAGTVGGNAVVSASPSVDHDEWPSGSGGFAAARASMEPRPRADEDDSGEPIRTELVDPDADEVDAVPDPVE